jgi:hypothetical protein
VPLIVRDSNLGNDAFSENSAVTRMGKRSGASASERNYFVFVLARYVELTLLLFLMRCFHFLACDSAYAGHDEYEEVTH